MILSLKQQRPNKLGIALAVKMILSGKSYHEVKELLKVSQSFISQ